MLFGIAAVVVILDQGTKLLVVSSSPPLNLVVDGVRRANDFDGDGSVDVVTEGPTGAWTAYLNTSGDGTAWTLVDLHPGSGSAGERLVLDLDRQTAESLALDLERERRTLLDGGRDRGPGAVARDLLGLAERGQGGLAAAGDQPGTLLPAEQQLHLRHDAPRLFRRSGIPDRIGYLHRGRYGL